MWEISTGKTIRKFSGHKHDKHVLHSCFGGIDEGFIASGSEGQFPFSSVVLSSHLNMFYVDGNVYIWHRDTATLLETLEGHGNGSVNSVVWNPRNQRMFASCSDDRTVRIWEAPITVAAPTADVSDFAHENDGAGKGKGKDKEVWGVNGLSGESSYEDLGGVARSW
jgi:WD repeat-containing protein 26